MTEANWYSDETATFGDRLAAAREAADLTPKELAHRLGVSQPTLENWENDVSEPRANRLTMLSGILNVSLSWLMTGEGQGVSPDAEPLAGDATEILSEMRQLRAEMTRAATRLGVLEKRLREAMRVDA
jgi:transcriptional regulator with XRE-family HTH domain